MRDLRSELARLIGACAPRDGIFDSPVPGTSCVRYSHANERSRLYWCAAVCIVAQGSKEIAVGPEVYRFDTVHYVATPIDLPVIGRVASASPEKPFLCLRIGLDPNALREVDVQLGGGGQDREPDGSPRGVFVGDVGERMLQAAVRLGELFLTPEDAAALGPLSVKEILYHLLKGPDGPAIRQFIHAGSAMDRVSRAIYLLKTTLNEDLDVDAMARAVSMSRSAFFTHFKAATAMSPVQYQKRLRLLEARRLMVTEGETAEGSAFRVGYRSASQFSREYSRMFGTPPSRDAKRQRQAVSG
ncbi:MAG TPA: AraC family transcriptional regulator [Spirochaetia bacterium]|nr:AraC family transcriptional regulator [Spirochaetia bacterium]